MLHSVEGRHFASQGYRDYIRLASRYVVVGPRTVTRPGVSLKQTLEDSSPSRYSLSLGSAEHVHLALAARCFRPVSKNSGSLPLQSIAVP